MAGMLGVPLSDYTGVLLGATSLPGWNVRVSTKTAVFDAGMATAACPLAVAESGHPVDNRPC